MKLTKLDHRLTNIAFDYDTTIYLINRISNNDYNDIITRTITVLDAAIAVNNHREWSNND